MNVKRAQLLWTYKETKEKLNQMKTSYLTSVDRIKQLDAENPDYKEQYLEKYMSARREAGIPDEKSSFVEYLGLDINTEWDSFDGQPDTTEETISCSDETVCGSVDTCTTEE